MKLAVSLLAAGFPLKHGGECTRLMKEGRESFTWHFCTVSARGEDIVPFLQAWEKPVSDAAPVDPMSAFLVAREVMLGRNWLLSESHKVPAQHFRERDGNRLLYTPRLKPEDRARLAQLAS